MKPRYPKLYSIRAGDTFSAIAERELGKASLWKRIAELNPHIPDPHLIYPGDVIVLP